MSPKPCPRCRAPVPAVARFCGQCGYTIQAEAPRAKTMVGHAQGADSHVPIRQVPDLGRTMNDPEMKARAREMREQIGVAPTEAPKPLDIPARPALSKTMLMGGADATPAASPVAPTVSEPSPLSRSVMAPESWKPPAPAAAAPSAEKGAGEGAAETMFGMPASSMPQPAPAPVSAFAPAQRTMLGVAIPGVAPTKSGTPERAPAPGPVHVRSAQGTMLGVAAPGVAPTRPAAQSQATVPATPPILPAPPPLVDEPLPEAPQRAKKTGVSAVAVVGILIALVAALGGAGALLALRGGAPLTAIPQLDESGKESLKIACPSCPDGTTVSLGTSSAKVQGSAAVLALPAPLSIGDNDLTVTIDRPGAGRDEDVKIHAPVAYRVRADLTTLTAKPPTITVRVEAAPGTTVEIDGKTVALDGSGRAAYAIALGRETEGPSDEQKVFDRKISFSITPKGGAPEKGEIAARAAIVPLHLDAPGLALVTDKGNAPVAGQTRPGATVTVDGAAAPVDDKGRFGVRIEIPQIGERTLEIVASAPALAPRVVHAKITRAASLDEAAKALAAERPAAYDAFGPDPARKIGQKAVVEGEVVEIRAAQGHSTLLVEEKKACSKGAQCLVRVDHGEEDKVARGDTIRAFGVVAGAVSSGGKSVPHLEAALVVPVKAGGK